MQPRASTAGRLASKGIAFADAPVARTREAAQRGELSIMVGADEALYARIEPFLRYMGSDVTRCGGVGCGQVVKLVNNALVFENTVAIAEMMVLGERAGVAPAVLLDAVSKGSGDSYALRNHARKSMLPRQFPEKSFPPEYVLKDIGYVLELAAQVGVVGACHTTGAALLLRDRRQWLVGPLLSRGDRGRRPQYRPARLIGVANFSQSTKGGSDAQAARPSHGNRIGFSRRSRWRCRTAACSWWRSPQVD